MNRVAGKVALVTGAASGLGEAIARMLAREGATVVLADINDAAGQKVLAEVEASGATGLYMHLDTASEDDWVRAMALIEQRFQALHITVNCAGLNVGRSFPADTTLDDWRRVMSVNLDGVFLGTKHSVTLMSKSQPVNGSIVNISSVMGLVGYAGIAPYNASKGGVRLYSKSVALSCAERGLKIRVNSVHPGFIETPLLRQGMKSIPDPEDAQRIYIALQPVGHLGEPDDIAYGVLYLASDESKFVTGAELVIDGGYTAR
jgi:3(or 17)beta-hydroxysteroid dehydrogenase